MNKIKRHIFILCISILTFVALIPNKASFAAEYKSLWQYPKDELEKIVEICFTSSESYGRTYYHLNNEMISLLPVEAKAMIVAEMYNCYNGRISSDDKDISMYIGIFSEAYKDIFYGNKFEYLELSEAGEFFKSVYEYLIPDKSQDKKDDLIDLINKYIFRLEVDYDYPDETLDNYKQVLDTFTVIDGKITSDSNKCILISKKKQSVKIGSKYEDHNVSVYLVTEPGTIKYTSLDKSTGKSKNYKKKYISLGSAIDKDLVKTYFSDKQVKFLTVKKATVENAKKIHKLLLTGKEQVIKIPGSKKEKAGKILSELKSMVSEVNKGGYTFTYYEYPMATDSTIYIRIDEYDAKNYNLCAEFYKRLEKQYKKLLEGDDFDYKDRWYYAYTEYPDEQERLINLCYYQLVKTVQHYGNDYYNTNTIHGLSHMITSDGTELQFRVIDFKELNKSFKLNHLSMDSIVKNISSNVLELYSLEEFRHLPDINEILAEYREAVGFMNNDELKNYVEKTKAENILLQTLAEKPFYKLSDAEKVYALSLSGVFSCVKEHPDDGRLQMVYNLYADPELGIANLQNLLDGKSEGVCENYANFECSIFDTLGLKSFKNRGYMHGGPHAWSVVKIVNNAGKEFWVPFDYGVIWNSSDETFKYYIELRTDSLIDSKEIGEDPKYIPFTLKDFTE